MSLYCETCGEELTTSNICPQCGDITPTIKNKTHILKCDSSPFSATWEGLKPYEVRNNDREYQVNDMLLLKETRYSYAEMQRDYLPLQYTGWEILCIVTHIRAASFLIQGYKILTITVIKREIKGVSA